MTGLRVRRDLHPRPAVRALRAVAVLAALAVTGCGPTPPLEVAVREFPSTVSYGGTAAPSPAAVPVAPAPAPAPIVPVPLPPVVGPPPVPTEITLPTPTCPTAQPLAAPPTAATADASATPPKETGYTFRLDGSYVSGGQTTRLPASALETVMNTTFEPNTHQYTFDVVDSASGLRGDQTVTTTYQVVPEPNGGQVGGQPTSQASGIYITRIVTANAIASQSTTFAPVPPILYLPFPASSTPQPSWTVKSADAGNGDVEQLTASVVQESTVDACGNVFDGWEVTAAGSLTGPTQNLSINERYWVGTEYGGITMESIVAYTGTDQANGPQVSSHSTRVINTAPANPQ